MNYFDVSLIQGLTVQQSLTAGICNDFLISAVNAVNHLRSLTKNNVNGLMKQNTKLVKKLKISIFNGWGGGYTSLVYF